MPQAPFPPWANQAARWGLACAGLLVLGTVGGLMTWVRTPYNLGRLDPPPQPVPFDHRHHVQDAGIDCRYCHASVERARTAGMPSSELCLNCHGQIWNEAETLEPVRRSVETGEPIAWRRVHDLADFAYFDHAAHVRRGVGCASCHGAVSAMPSVYQVAPLTMSWCLDCHREPARHLRPQDRITDDAWRGDPALGRAIAAERGIDPPVYCTACHR